MGSWSTKAKSGQGKSLFKAVNTTSDASKSQSNSSNLGGGGGLSLRKGTAKRRNNPLRDANNFHMGNYNTTSSAGYNRPQLSNYTNTSGTQPQSSNNKVYEYQYKPISRQIGDLDEDTPAIDDPEMDM